MSTTEVYRVLNRLCYISTHSFLCWLTFDRVQVKDVGCRRETGSVTTKLSVFRFRLSATEESTATIVRTNPSVIVSRIVSNTDNES